ncbi:MAG TPA: hypothetical protein VN905_13600, partial [Candidatus Binatia bacterium]|nr:hypothetical protein [Candidatus Binatia bacterium]
RWLRYPSGPVRPGGEPGPLDEFMPQAEVDERVSIYVAALPAAVIAAARSLDLARIPAVRALFASRAFLTGAGRGSGIPSGPFMTQVRSLGWELLAEEAGRFVIFGAVTKPWEGNVLFRPLKPPEFLAFDEPGFAKIAWTVRVESQGSGSLCVTETRVVTTSAEARRKFRRYWAVFSPGILLIRYIALWSIKGAAERSRTL